MNLQADRDAQDMALAMAVSSWLYDHVGFGISARELSDACKGAGVMLGRSDEAAS